MREIKFRAWVIKDKKFTQNIVIEPMGIIWWQFGNSIHAIERDEIEISQFTGLKDKNSKEIYEGDILEYERHLQDPMRYVAEWNEKSNFQLHWQYPENKMLGVVIGNIWENPELLK